MTTNSELIAGLAGPVLAAVAIAILVNRRTITGLLGDAGNGPGFIFFAGLLTLLAGLAIVRAHNIWAPDWRVLVTILGWVLVITGIIRIIWPDRVVAKRDLFLRNENVITAWALVALALGAFLTAKGYGILI
jgi:hypothetical protein